MKSRVLHSFIIICVLLCSVLQASTQKINKKVRMPSFAFLLILFKRNFYWIHIYAFITNCSSCYSLSFLVKFWGWDLPQTKLNCQKWKIFSNGMHYAKETKLIWILKDWNMHSLVSYSFPLPLFNWYFLHNHFILVTIV